MSLQSLITHPTFISLISERQALLGISDEHLDSEIVFTHLKIIARIKDGSMKLPSSRIEVLASALAYFALDLLLAALVE